MIEPPPPTAMDMNLPLPSQPLTSSDKRTPQQRRGSPTSENPKFKSRSPTVHGCLNEQLKVSFEAAILVCA